MPLHIPSKLIIFVSTIVSTFISLLAGYLLYAESISVLRSAVEESSAAASKSAKLRLSGMLDRVRKNANEGILLFNRDDVFNISMGMEHIENVYRVQAFASLKSSEEFYSTGYTLAKIRNAFEDPQGYSKGTVWFDPIFNSSGGEDEYWFSGATKPVVTPDGINWKRKFTALNNDTGVKVHFSEIAEPPPVLNVTWDINMKSEIENIENTPMEGKWTPTMFWNSVDGSPYAYNSFEIRYTPPWAEGKYHLVLISWFMFRPWTSVIREFETANTELVVLDPSAGQVFAHTLFDGLAAVKTECFTHCFQCTEDAGADCVLHPNDLGPTVSDAVNSSKVRPRGTFFTADLSSTNMRIHVQYGKYFAASDVNKTTPLYKKDYFVDTSLEGGEYFLQLTHVYTASDTTFELLWMRSVSSVNDKVYAALVQLIIASVVIFVVDLIIAVLEVTLIARPLEKLVVGNQYLETMELDGAEAHMNAVYKPIMVQEVARVTDGLLMAIKGLREYKAYLPSTLFVDDTDDVESANSGSTRATEKSGQSRTVPVAAAAGQNLLISMQSYKGVVVRLSFVEQLYASFPDDFGSLVEIVHETALATRGLSHGFSVSNPLLFTLTWNVGSRCTDAILRAVTFCKAISSSARVLQIATPAMAVSHGDLLAGNLGSATHKGFGMKGPAMHELKGVSSVSECVSSALARSVILVPPVVAEGVAGRYCISAVTLLKVAGIKNMLLLYEVGAVVEINEEEWMYQLEESGCSIDPIASALKRVLLSNDKSVSPALAKIARPTDIQKWAMRNIREGRAVMSSARSATW